MQKQKNHSFLSQWLCTLHHCIALIVTDNLLVTTMGHNFKQILSWTISLLNLLHTKLQPETWPGPLQVYFEAKYTFSYTWVPKLTSQTHILSHTSRCWDFKGFFGFTTCVHFPLHFLYLKLFNPCRSPNWVVLICSVHPILHVLKMGKSHEIWGGFSGWLLIPCLKLTSSFTICPSLFMS